MTFGLEFCYNRGSGEHTRTLIMDERQFYTEKEETRKVKADLPQLPRRIRGSGALEGLPEEKKNCRAESGEETEKVRQGQFLYGAAG